MGLAGNGHIIRTRGGLNRPGVCLREMFSLRPPSQAWPVDLRSSGPRREPHTGLQGEGGACLRQDWPDDLDFPAEHWKHLRTTNPVESTFATVPILWVLMTFRPLEELRHGTTGKGVDWWPTRFPSRRPSYRFDSTAL